ncbi:DUF4432 family protein [Nonomuraea sp. NPDC000554]|uniref:DUF4432 family protein n=1 Tax=Nonomuraea sp. NPDC000554 TaxID=3154259 RepID=UPI00331D941E
MTDLLTLDNGLLSVVIDAGRGAEILSLTHRDSGIDVLFATPWRDVADAIRAGTRAPSTTDPTAAWLERYRGGWQTLIPNAGPPRSVCGAPVGFHGEASSVPWEVCRSAPMSTELRTTLFSVPIEIERLVSLDTDRAAVSTCDVLHNLSDVEVEIDYVNHPAFAGPLLDGRCSVDTGARVFTADPDTDGNIAAGGTSHAWPWIERAEGTTVDLRVVPPPGERHMAFGWLSDFDGHYAAITNHDLGLTVRMEWDGTHLPYAWWWQEINHMKGFPWYRRARVIAIEPSSTVTSGPSRRSVLRVPGGSSVRLPMTVSIEGRAR